MALALAVASVAVTVTLYGLLVSALLATRPEMAPVELLMVRPLGSPVAAKLKALLAESEEVSGRVTVAPSWLLWLPGLVRLTVLVLTVQVKVT